MTAKSNLTKTTKAVCLYSPFSKKMKIIKWKDSILIAYNELICHKMPLEWNTFQCETNNLFGISVCAFNFMWHYCHFKQQKSVIEKSVERNERHAVKIHTLDKVSLSMHRFAKIRNTYVLIGCSKMDFHLKVLCFLHKQYLN